jgi:hypothetical protein
MEVDCQDSLKRFTLEPSYGELLVCKDDQLGAVRALSQYPFSQDEEEEDWSGASTLVNMIDYGTPKGRYRAVACTNSAPSSSTFPSWLSAVPWWACDLAGRETSGEARRQCATGSVADPDPHPDLVGSVPFCRIQIRIRI